MLYSRTLLLILNSGSGDRESILDYLGALNIVLPIEAEGDLTTAGDVKLTASCRDAG